MLGGISNTPGEGDPTGVRGRALHSLEAALCLTRPHEVPLDLVQILRRHSLVLLQVREHVVLDAQMNCRRGTDQKKNVSAQLDFHRLFRSWAAHGSLVKEETAAYRLSLGGLSRDKTTSPFA